MKFSQTKEAWPLARQEFNTIIELYSPIAERAKMGGPRNDDTGEDVWPEFTPCEPMIRFEPSDMRLLRWFLKPILDCMHNLATKYLERITEAGLSLIHI